MAMGLASINPVVGAANGALMIRQKPDKDLENDPWAQYGVTRNFDSDSMIGMNNGRLILKKTKDLKECMVYLINASDADKIFDKLLQEAMQDKKLEIEDPGYIYSAFTGHYLLTDDQLVYQTSVWLKKYSCMRGKCICKSILG